MPLFRIVGVPALWFSACHVLLGLIGSPSVRVLQCLGGASFDVGVPVGRGGGARVGEKVPSLWKRERRR